MTEHPPCYAQDFETILEGEFARIDEAGGCIAWFQHSTAQQRFLCWQEFGLYMVADLNKIQACTSDSCDSCGCVVLSCFFLIFTF